MSEKSSVYIRLVVHAIGMRHAVVTKRDTDAVP